MYRKVNHEDSLSIPNPGPLQTSTPIDDNRILAALPYDPNCNYDPVARESPTTVKLLKVTWNNPIIEKKENDKSLDKSDENQILNKEKELILNNINQLNDCNNYLSDESSPSLMELCASDIDFSNQLENSCNKPLSPNVTEVDFLNLNDNQDPNAAKDELPRPEKLDLKRFSSDDAKISKKNTSKDSLDVSKTSHQKSKPFSPSWVNLGIDDIQFITSPPPLKTPSAKEDDLISRDDDDLKTNFDKSDIKLEFLKSNSSVFYSVSSSNDVSSPEKQNKCKSGGKKGKIYINRLDSNENFDQITPEMRRQIMSEDSPDNIIYEASDTRGRHTSSSSESSTYSVIGK